MINHTCAVSRLNGRGCWWVTIIDKSEQGDFVKVKGNKMFGRARWVRLSDCHKISKKPVKPHSSQ
jgi:hypothetical protein